MFSRHGEARDFSRTKIEVLYFL